jgi:hypothetical protein
MKSMKKLGYLVLIIVTLVACDGKSSFVQKQSVGSINKVMVVVKSSDWLGEVGDTLRSSFGKIVVGLPQPEPTVTLSQVAPAGFGNMMKSSRSILIVEESEKEQFSIKYNVYANPQTVVYLSAKEDADLNRLFKQHEKEILAAFRQADITTTQKIFAKSKLEDAAFKTFQNLGLSFTIHNQFRTVEDTGDFLWLRHHLKSGIAQTGSNNILVYSVPLEDETKVAERIIEVRNAIGKKYIPGSDPETMYMITEEAYTPVTYEAEIDGKKAYETRGKWEVKNDFMAGPFLNYSVIDAKNNRVIVFEGFTYAPSVNKREFVFELEAIGKSMKIQ